MDFEIALRRYFNMKVLSKYTYEFPLSRKDWAWKIIIFSEWWDFHTDKIFPLNQASWACFRTIMWITILKERWSYDLVSYSGGISILMMWDLYIGTVPDIRVHFVYVPSQWETALQGNIVSHWLSAYTTWSLQICLSESMYTPLWIVFWMQNRLEWRVETSLLPMFFWQPSGHLGCWTCQYFIYWANNRPGTPFINID